MTNKKTLEEKMGAIIEEVHNKSLTRYSFPCNPVGEDEWQKYRKKRRNEFIQLIKKAVRKHDLAEIEKKKETVECVMSKSGGVVAHDPEIVYFDDIRKYMTQQMKGEK